MSSLVALGVDPDLHNCGFAFVRGDRVLYAGCVTVPTKVKGAEAAVAMSRNFAAALEVVPYRPEITIVEGQQLYDAPGKRHRRPQDIVHLANAAGAVVGAAHISYPSTKIHLPKPNAWKGSIAKGVKQGRILKCAGIEDFKCSEASALPMTIPAWGKHIRKSQWTHVIDAIGLAQWGLKAPRVQRSLRRADAAAGG